MKDSKLQILHQLPDVILVNIPAIEIRAWVRSSLERTIDVSAKAQRITHYSLA